VRIRGHVQHIPKPREAESPFNRRSAVRYLWRSCRSVLGEWAGFQFRTIWFGNRELVGMLGLNQWLASIPSSTTDPSRPRS
jgi:hypothetical protein